MWRYMAGAAAALLMIAAGVVLFNARARPDPVLPAQPRATGAQSSTAAAEDEPLPDAAPEATARTREQKRFDRYDKDRDGRITRDEYLMQRRKAYAKLDTNGDGRLSFEEWGAKTIAKFGDADADRSGSMSRGEFATTAVKRKPRATPRCACPAPAADDD